MGHMEHARHVVAAARLVPRHVRPQSVRADISARCDDLIGATPGRNPAPVPPHYPVDCAEQEPACAAALEIPQLPLTPPVPEALIPCQVCAEDQLPVCFGDVDDPVRPSEHQT